MSIKKVKDVEYPKLPEINNITTIPQETKILPRNIFASGTLPGNTVIRIGDSNITIDGANRRILISDGTNDRVLIGFQESGF
jgi:hypothetical protein